ncbi:MAG: FHA domain-containing protein [Deltaproteobacteria bacterium]|nr:FHA domain-containing protein [Deltaproteobacteria bacterium]
MIKSCLILETQLTKKRVFPFYAKMIIGRHSTNDIPLPDRTVSKRHAVIGRVRGQAVVKDLGSRNGTFVNGQKVEKAILSCGDRLKVGSVMLRFFQEEETPTGKDAENTITLQCVQKLGECLVKAGIIDEMTLLGALGEDEKSLTIDQMLTGLGLLDDDMSARALARQLKFPFMSLKEREIPQQVTSLVTTEVAKTHVIVPVELAGGKLLVAMADPLDSAAIQVLRVTTGMSIEVVVASREDILEAIGKYYPAAFMEKVLDGTPDLDEVTVDMNYLGEGNE